MEHPKDGLYQIDHGKIHKYKGKGGTVRIYDLIEIPSELDVMTLKSEAEALGYVAIKKSEFEAYHEKPTDCPLIDIVTCGECIHHDEDGWGYGECKRPSVVYLRTADEDFCSKAERRAE